MAVVTVDVPVMLAGGGCLGLFLRTGLLLLSGGVGGDMDLLLFYFDICYLLFVYIDMRLLEGLNV